MIRTLRLFLLLCVAGTSLSFSQTVKELQLPLPQTDIGKPLMQVLKARQSARSFDARTLSSQELSNVLWAADGINRPEVGKRTAPSAMNWQEIDVYVALPEGTFLYDAKLNKLVPVASKDLRELTGKQPFVKDAPVTFVYVSDGAKIKNASGEDRQLFTAADAGFIAQNVYLYCASQGLAVVVRGMIDRPQLARELNLRPEQKIILAQTIGYPKP
ncbi:MAG TPA: SagB/ThcOx family dehydrogenase [Bacteroidota bacterium]|nr:SagB/ThcOx family dehydrogenase [Bacteroidota bacterium]